MGLLCVCVWVCVFVCASRLACDMNPWRLQERILGGQFPSWATRQNKNRLKLIPFMVNSLLRCWGYVFTCWVFFLCLNLWQATYEMCRNKRVVRQKRNLIIVVTAVISAFAHIFSAWNLDQAKVKEVMKQKVRAVSSNFGCYKAGGRKDQSLHSDVNWHLF